jgi:hypothetical protein
MSLNGTAWTPIGPSPISENTTQDNGLVTAIAINPYNQNIVYIGTAGGGVWRTRDAGANWSPLFDRQVGIGIGEPGGVAIDPNNTDIVYAGTSQRVIVGNNSAQGLFKSQDAGSSWIQLGSGFPVGNTGNALSTFFGSNINVVIVDPTNSNIIYCAASNGVFRSTDGGLNWAVGANTAGSDARSLVLDLSSPANARILYAGISGRGVFQSTDDGRTWSAILSGASPIVSALFVGPTTGFNKVIVALAPPAAVPNSLGIQVIYVTMEGTTSLPPPAAPVDPLALFVSKDQGVTWTQAATGPALTAAVGGTQGGYSFHMAIDPASPGDGANDIIYFGAVGQAKSTNSGASFTGLPSVSGLLHPDTHAWAFFPQPSAPSIVYIGCDGGIDRSTDGGGTWNSVNAGGLQTSLFYNIDLRPGATASVTVGALQDNELETTATPVSSALGWNGARGGGGSGFADGWDVAYDATNPSQVYCSSGAWAVAPQTRVFRSTNDGLLFPTDITPWTTATDAGVYLAPVTTDPTTGGIVYVSGNQNLWQSRDAANPTPTWRIIGSFGGTGNVDVAPSNGNNVVIAVGTQVFVSTNALAATVGPPTGVTFTNITPNLPGRTVTRARFDPVDPTVIYAVLGGFSGAVAGQSSGHVFRKTIGASAWTDISPVVKSPIVGSPDEKLDVPFNALALDGTDIPTTIYVGTDLGVLRSMDVGKSWSVLDDIHFPRVPVADLVLNPTAGILVAATYGRGAFKFTKPVVAAIAVNLQDNLDFGTICSGPQYLTLTVYNVGGADLVITNVQRLFGSSDFTVLATPATPVTVSPGEEIEFTVRFTPTAAGVLEQAIIRVTSNDPTAPFVDVLAQGEKGTGKVATVIANNGSFGNVCLGAFVDEPLTINNSGVCPLSISGIASSSAEFLVPAVISFPLVVAAGGSIQVPIRFQPASFGSKAGVVITITSDDPASPARVAVSGIAPAPRLALALADAGNFGPCCIGSFLDEPLLLSNSGACTLSATAISSSLADFLVPEVLSFPLTIEAGNALSVPIRFQPASLGAKSATITVTSNDPSGPHTVSVSGIAPPGKLAVTGSTVFGGVKCCRREQRRVSVCNVGECPLHVSRVRFRRRRRHFRLINNPFPATLHPGSCLDVVIQYRATERVPRSCELVIMSDDPDHPVRHLDLIAWTIWECCEECRCECRKECCKDRREECCKRRSKMCREDEDEDEDRDEDEDEDEDEHKA